MHIVAGIVAALFILTILVVIFGNLYGIVAAVVDYFFGDRLHLIFLRKPLQHKYRVVLDEKFGFYRKLPEQRKLLFEKKVQRFIDSKEFLQGNDLEAVSTEMIALISATAVQITFGFPRVYLNHFQKIFIYADVYQSKVTGQYHQGEVNTRGAIVLSWRSFVFGLADETDGRNLGLHEMAHALRIENAIRNKEYDFLDYDALVKFTSEGRREIQKIVDRESGFFRHYGATNDQEFFAVAMENFFERPEEFHQYNPRLYTLMADILRQDPLRHTGRAVVTPG